MYSFEFIEMTVKGNIAVIELNRPRQLNSLNRKMVCEIVTAMEMFDREEEVRIIVLTGKGRSFSAGADIDEMTDDDPISLELLNQFADWDRLTLIKKPIIGAVKGFVFGGGFELALCCDLLISENGTQFYSPKSDLASCQVREVRSG